MNQIEYNNKNFNLLQMFDAFIDQYNSYLEENRQNNQRKTIIPTRRWPATSSVDSNRTIERAKKAVFIKDNEILQIHPMRYRRHSPFFKPLTPEILNILEDDAVPAPTIYGKDRKGFLQNILDDLQKKLYAIAITDDDRHVILQQAIKSCVASCVGMLLLDRRCAPRWKFIQESLLADSDDAIGWISQSGLTPIITWLNGDFVSTLSKLISEHGSGILSLSHPVIGGHVIILDQITSEIAIIRDSFHGWSVTLPSNKLLEWICSTEYFIQIE